MKENQTPLPSMKDLADMLEKTDQHEPLKDEVFQEQVNTVTTPTRDEVIAETAEPITATQIEEVKTAPVYQPKTTIPSPVTHTVTIPTPITSVTPVNPVTPVVPFDYSYWNSGNPVLKSAFRKALEEHLMNH